MSAARQRVRAAADPAATNAGQGTTPAAALERVRSLIGAGHAIAAWPAMVWAFAFMVAPLALMVVYSFWRYSNFRVEPAFTLDNYRAFFSSPIYVGILLRTILIAVLTTAITIAIAYPVALLVYRLGRVAAAILIVLITIPFWVNQLVRNFAFYSVLGETGLINSLLNALGLQSVHMMFTTGAVVTVAVYVFLPYAVVMLYVSLERLSPSLVEAAHDLGASDWQTFRKVLLPLSSSGLQSAALLVFILSLGMFLTPAMIGGGRVTMMATLLVPIVEQALNFARGAAFSVVLLGLVLFVVAAMARLVDLEKVYSSGVGRATSRRSEGRPGTPILLYIGTVLAFLYVPIVLVVVFSFDSNIASGFPLRGFTTSWYEKLFDNAIMHRALGNSLLIGLFTAVLSTAVAVPAAYAVVRFKFVGRGLLRLLILIPIVVPELLLGVSLLFLLNAVGIPLSIITVALGHATYALPFVFFVVLAQQYGFDRSIELAARDLGANEWQKFRKITLPLMIPAIFSGAILSFTLSLNDFILAFMLTGTETTLPVFMWSLLQTTTSPEINAVSSMLVFGTVLIVLIPIATVMLRQRRRRRAMRMVAAG